MFNLEFKQVKKTLKTWVQLPSWIRHLLPVGKQIVMLRSALGITQEQLSQRMGTTQRMIVRLEKEEGDPQLSTLKRAAESLNCELLVRLVPKIDLEKLLNEKARKKAEKLVTMSAASANLELQKPSKSIIQSEVRRLTQEILVNKRSLLWEE